MDGLGLDPKLFTILSGRYFWDMKVISEVSFRKQAKGTVSLFNTSMLWVVLKSLQRELLRYVKVLKLNPLW